MNTFSKISLLLTACSALFLPACGTGGGGENRDYYVSVQKFKGGAKGFLITGSPRGQIFATSSGFNGNQYGLSSKFMQMVALGEAEDGGEEGGTDGESAYVEGVIRFESGTDPIDAAYYTVGGASGHGYLYITFQGSEGPSGNVIHMLGASTPEDVKMAGLSGSSAQFWTVPSIGSILIASTEGTTIKMGFDFSSGIVDMRLVHGSAATATHVQQLMNEGKTYEEVMDEVMAEQDQILVIRLAPYLAVEG